MVVPVHVPTKPPLVMLAVTVVPAGTLSPPALVVPAGVTLWLCTAALAAGKVTVALRAGEPPETVITPSIAGEKLRPGSEPAPSRSQYVHSVPSSEKREPNR